jgi:ribonuclease Z
LRSVFHPYLPNGADGDPALWIDLPDEGHSVLVDLGDLSRIPSRKLLRVDRVLVTHTHIDHFIGFDHLLRLVLSRRERELTLTGPPGFLRNVQGKIEGYTWNLIGSYPVKLIVEEVDGDTLSSVAYSGEGRMRPEPQPRRPFRGLIEAHRAYTIHVDLLDHGIPVLGVALRETEHLSVNKDRLDAMGLRPGPWLAELKQAVRRCSEAGRTVDAETVDGTTRTLECAELEREILFRTQGQKIAYFTDVRYTEPNVERIVALGRAADLMICEAVFLDEDEELARDRFHLTARQAGELARAAGARRLAVFHFSPRYTGREEELIRQASGAFGRPVVHLPRGPML